MFKNRIKVKECGDIDIEYNGTYYEYDSISNRYYRLDDGTTVNSPDGKLAKRRISKKEFIEIQKQITEKEDI